MLIVTFCPLPLTFLPHSSRLSRARTDDEAQVIRQHTRQTCVFAASMHLLLDSSISRDDPFTFQIVQRPTEKGTPPSVAAAALDKAPVDSVSKWQYYPCILSPAVEIRI